MSDELKRYGSTALVTGASSGIGQAMARRLAESGLDLVLTARRSERLEALAAELEDRHGVEVTWVAVDLAEPDFLETLLPACENREIGIIVSNAGCGIKGLHHEADAAALSSMLAVNCRAPLLLAHAFAPKLIARGIGAILLTGSIEAYVGFPYSSAYAASKAFTLSFGEGLWGELKRSGIDVLVVNPGATDTEILRHSGMDPADMTGLMEPEQVAELALAQLGHGPVYVPGAINRFFVALMRWLPRRIAVQLMGRSMRAAIEQGRARKPPNSA
jgi:short-subunit dehydrogenase